MRSIDVIETTIMVFDSETLAHPNGRRPLKRSRQRTRRLRRRIHWPNLRLAVAVCLASSLLLAHAFYLPDRLRPSLALYSRRRPGTGFGEPSGKDPRRRRRSTTNSTVDAPPAAPEGNLELQTRVTQLEQLVSTQAVDIKRMKDQIRNLTSTVETFAKVVTLLREAGLSADDDEDEVEVVEGPITAESFDDAEIFGQAPSSVIEAADVAGASILAAMLGGKQRMLVDVRDSELSTSSETLVQFIELAILPVAAGLEGLKAKRNRLKIVFPTVSQLLEYRRTMALAAPEVVALSTLGFDPVEQQDNLVVIVAPSPDDEEGLAAMNALLEPNGNSRRIDQPVVVLNHHMVPLSGPACAFEVAYHLRLLSVQYVSGDAMPEQVEAMLDSDDLAVNMTKEEALEAAMRHAQTIGSHHGTTRAMVIRSYPNPWHVFVDTSPDTDADFEVASTFETEPTMEQINQAIVECLEGSEQEDEIVAQQMQQALENGQLDQVSDLLGGMGLDFDHDDDEDDEDDKWDFDNDWNLFDEDSV